MRMHKLEVYVIDFEDYGIGAYYEALQNNFGLNAAVARVIPVGTTDIGRWHDDHPLNFSNTPNTLFSERDFE